MNKDVVFLVGPTATGKTAVSVDLASMLDAEIVSCDSMQVYRGVRVLNARPPDSCMSRVPHHLVDMVALEENFDVYRFFELAQDAIRDILERGKKVICVGGTGLYYSILLDGIFTFSSKDQGVREELQEMAYERGGSFLHSELQKVDPASAEKIHPNDLKRIIRALEVYRLSGRPLSELKTQRKGVWSEYRVRVFGLLAARHVLYEMINQRVELMFQEEVVDEVKNLEGRRLSNTFRQIIGYSQIKDYLDGKMSLEEAKEEIKKNTRRFAKRQLTWFKKDKRISWVRVDQFKDAGEVAVYLKKRLKA